jgi:hypothetical protein
MSVLSDTTVNLSNYKTKLNLLNGFSKQFTSQMETMEIHERSIPNSNHRNCRSQQHKISHAKSNVKDRRNNIMVGTDHLPQHRRRTYYKSVTSSGTSNPPVTKQTSPITDHRADVAVGNPDTLRSARSAMQERTIESSPGTVRPRSGLQVETGMSKVQEKLGLISVDRSITAFSRRTQKSKRKLSSARFQVLTVTRIQTAVFSDVAPCSLVDINKRFEMLTASIIRAAACPACICTSTVLIHLSLHYFVLIYSIISFLFSFLSPLPIYSLLLLRF